MLALFTDERRLVTATALEETRTLRIERSVFFDLLEDHSAICLGLLERMVQNIKALSNR